MPNPITDLATLLSIAKQKGLQSDKIKNELLGELYSLRQGMDAAERVEGLKSEVNTGPIIGRTPNWMVDFYGMVAPESAAKRRKMESSLLDLMNPYRKEVTGAQAAIQELTKFIKPRFPMMTDEDKVFMEMLEDYKGKTRQNAQTIIDFLNRLGYKTQSVSNVTR